MKKLKNWDNNNWLSSKSYISQFNKFLETKVNLNNNSKILDIGCGRANIISALQKKYKFKNKPIGIDVVTNKDVKKNIVFKKIDALKYLKKQEKYDLILIKQTIHFFSKMKLSHLLNLAKRSLNPEGKILIFSLKTRNNKIPCFKKMKILLNKSLKKDETILAIIKKNLKKSKESYFKYNVNISSKKYSKMINDRYISCLLSMNQKVLKSGIDEINNKFGRLIKFEDVLKCVSYRK